MKRCPIASSLGQFDGPISVYGLDYKTVLLLI